MKKSEVFESVLCQFESERLRAFCEDVINSQGDYNMIMPASTSCRYHNATQCGRYGQVYHVLMAGEIANYILGLKYVKEHIVTNSDMRDYIRIAVLCHDICKTNGGKFTVHEHPLLGGHYIRNVKVEHNITFGERCIIARLIESHSGEWTTSKYSDITLPEPVFDDEFIVHLCDYLASRKNLDYICDESIIEKWASDESE